MFFFIFFFFLSGNLVFLFQLLCCRVTNSLTPRIKQSNGCTFTQFIIIAIADDRLSQFCLQFIRIIKILFHYTIVFYTSIITIQLGLLTQFLDLLGLRSFCYKELWSVYGWQFNLSCVSSWKIKVLQKALTTSI